MPRWSIYLLLTGTLAVAIGCAPPAEKNGEPAAGETSTASGSDETGAESAKSWSGDSLDQWTTVFAEMKETLELSADEQQQLEDTFQQQVEKLQAWYQQHGPRIAEGDRTAMKAARDRDLATLRKLKDEIVPLKQEATALHKEMDVAVLNSLSEANRFRWQGHRLAARFFELANSIQLTDEQRTQVGELAVAAARRTQNQTTPQAAGFLEMEKGIEAKVLNPEQRTAYQEIKDRNKLRSLKTYSSFQPTRQPGQ